MGDNDSGKVMELPDTIPREHQPYIGVINTVTGIDHDHFTVGLEDEDIAPAGNLEAEKSYLIGKVEFLDIGIKPGSGCVLQRPSGGKDACENLP